MEPSFKSPAPAGGPTLNFRSRALGGLWGAVVGDALGVPVEFLARDGVRQNPVAGLRGFGTHRQPPGTWSDDSSMLLCTVEGFIETDGDLDDLGRRFVEWFRRGHWTAWGSVFDMGVTTADALRRIEHGVPAAQAGSTDELANGNGSLMRILPVALRYAACEPAEVLERAAQFSAITHGHPRSGLCCGLFCLVIQEVLRGAAPGEAMATARSRLKALRADAVRVDGPALTRLLTMDLASTDERDVLSTGYVVHTLEAALWCWLTTGSFAECVLRAVNLGGDTDTIGCVAGALAGVSHGAGAVPAEWLAGLAREADLDVLFRRWIERLPSPGRPAAGVAG